MFQTTLVSNRRELEQILLLQKKNLIHHIDESEMQSEGFVTLDHDLATLKKMHQLAPSVIIKDEEKLIGYALTMLKECRPLIPDLEPMFALFDHLKWNDKPLNDHRFYVMGQVCIDKEYRGQGLFGELYKHHKKNYKSQFDLFVTEIATRNHRSLRAHEKLGFKTIHVHTDEKDEWAVVAWDWN